MNCSGGRWPHDLRRPAPQTLLVESHGYQFEFRLAAWQWPKRGVALQYRQVSCPSSAHLYVGRNGQWWVDHIDRANPDQPCGMVVQHLVADVLR